MRAINTLLLLFTGNVLAVSPGVQYCPHTTTTECLGWFGQSMVYNTWNRENNNYWTYNNSIEGYSTNANLRMKLLGPNEEVTTQIANGCYPNCLKIIDMQSDNPGRALYAPTYLVRSYIHETGADDIYVPSPPLPLKGVQHYRPVDLNYARMEFQTTVGGTNYYLTLFSKDYLYNNFKIKHSWFATIDGKHTEREVVNY